MEGKERKFKDRLERQTKLGGGDERERERELSLIHI